MYLGLTDHDVAQFLKLLNGVSPFQIKPKVKVLPKNFRSQKNIVDFNNRFFAFLGSNIDNPEQKRMFEIWAGPKRLSRFYCHWRNRLALLQPSPPVPSLWARLQLALGALRALSRYLNSQR